MSSIVVEAPVEEGLAQVDREPHRRVRLQAGSIAGAAERPAQVAPEQAEGRERPVGAARVLEHLARLGVGVNDDRVVGQRAGRPPCPALLDGHASTIDDAATTHRKSRSAASRAPLAVAGSGATSASWRSRSTSCLTLRTKSPPDISSSAMTSPRSSPAAHA